MFSQNPEYFGEHATMSPRIVAADAHPRSLIAVPPPLGHLSHTASLASAIFNSEIGQPWAMATMSPVHFDVDLSLDPMNDLWWHEEDGNRGLSGSSSPLGGRRRILVSSERPMPAKRSDPGAKFGAAAQSTSTKSRGRMHASPKQPKTNEPRMGNYTIAEREKRIFQWRQRRLRNIQNSLQNDHVRYAIRLDLSKSKKRGNRGRFTKSTATDDGGNKPAVPATPAQVTPLLITGLTGLTPLPGVPLSLLSSLTPSPKGTPPVLQDVAFDAPPDIIPHSFT